MSRLPHFADPCSPNPCQNNGRCFPSGSSFTCSCTGGFSGTTCTNPPQGSKYSLITEKFVPRWDRSHTRCKTFSNETQDANAKITSTPRMGNKMEKSRSDRMLGFFWNSSRVFQNFGVAFASCVDCLVMSFDWATERQVWCCVLLLISMGRALISQFPSSMGTNTYRRTIVFFFGNVS